MVSLLAVALAFQAGGATLGVAVTALGSEDVAASGIPNLRGVLVIQVVAGGGANRAGIASGDILTTVAGEAVARPEALQRMIARRSPGEIVVVGVARPGNARPFPRLAFRVTLGGARAEAEGARQAAPRTGIGSLRTINANAVTMVAKNTNHCRALAPADWRIAGSRPQADALDLVSGDRRAYAGWGITAVNRQMQSYYGDQYGDPLQFSRFVVSTVSLQTLGAPAPYSYTARAHQLGAGFVARELESATHRAVVVYKLYPAPLGATYIISIRVAIAPKNSPQALNTATGVAVAINCTTQLIPRRNDDIELPKPGEPRRRSGSEADDLADYNPELGTQYVHSPSTGENYLVDRSAAWNENGPQGPGFYREVGNSYEKLQAGRAPQ